MKLSYIFFCLTLTSCVFIYNKKNLIPLNSIGAQDKSLKTDGYYYYIDSNRHYPYYKNIHGGYSRDKENEINQTLIYPIILYPDGSTKEFTSFSGMQDNLSFNYKSQCLLKDENTIKGSLEHFECYLRNRPKEKYNIFNNKARIWGNGVYKTNGHEIVYQVYTNHFGDYYLYEEKGRILNDSTFKFTSAKSYRTGKITIIDKKYNFKENKHLPNNESYIITHKNKFNSKK